MEIKTETRAQLTQLIRELSKTTTVVENEKDEVNDEWLEIENNTTRECELEEHKELLDDILNSVFSLQEYLETKFNIDIYS
jgi:hypothetical protein